MGRERNDFFRDSGIKPKEKIIVLSYEGNNTEAIYFEAFKETARFNDERIHLHSLRRPSDDTKSAPIHVFNKLKNEVKSAYDLDANDELWMIIDRDAWDIPTVYSLCVAEGNFYLALSNPCFEFWLLLHFKETADYSSAELIEMFNNLKTGKKTYLKRLLGTVVAGGYNESNPKPERFLPHIDLAVARSKALDIPAENYPTRLGSHLYKLVEKIIK